MGSSLGLAGLLGNTSHMCKLLIGKAIMTAHVSRQLSENANSQTNLNFQSINFDHDCSITNNYRNYATTVFGLKI